MLSKGFDSAAFLILVILVSRAAGEQVLLTSPGATTLDRGSRFSSQSSLKTAAGKMFDWVGLDLPGHLPNLVVGFEHGQRKERKGQERGDEIIHFQSVSLVV